jgi:hypothetical protein
MKYIELCLCTTLPQNGDRYTRSIHKLTTTDGGDSPEVLDGRRHVLPESACEHAATEVACVAHQYLRSVMQEGSLYFCRLCENMDGRSSPRPLLIPFLIGIPEIHEAALDVIEEIFLGLQ